MIRPMQIPDPLVELDIDLVFVHEKLFELEQRIEQHEEREKLFLSEILKLLEVIEKIPGKDAVRGREASA